MKFTVVLLIAACLQVSARSYSQSITLKLNGVTLEKAMKEISKQSGYQVFYQLEQIKSAKPVTVDMQKTDVRLVLDEVFKDQPLRYEITNKTIVVLAKPVAGAAIQSNAAIPPPANIDVTITVVSSENSQTLEGASVTVKGSNKGVATDVNGRAILKDVDPNATIVIGYTGYANQEVKVGGRSSVVVKLIGRANELEEVVINKGYYKTNRITEVGNVSAVTSKEIEKQPVSNILLSLQGRVPGLEVTQGNGIPGGGVKIKIRGQNSIGYGIDPLYIIDGVPYSSQNLPTVSAGVWGTSGGNRYVAATSGNPLAYINPADIESIDILKDADATAIYGSRGANGVILITTKSGKAGDVKINVNMQNGWGRVTKKLDLLDRRQYLDMRYEALKNDGLLPSADPNAGSPYSYSPDLALWDTTRSTDWQKELIGGTAIYQDVQASISGGNANTKFMLGTGYHRETTVFPGDLSDQKASVHFNINNVSKNSKFKISFTGNYVVDNNHLIGQDLTASAIKLAPVAPPLYNQDGTLNWAHDITGGSTWRDLNPISYLFYKFNSKTSNLVANSVLSYKIVPGLEIKSNFGYTNTQIDQLLTLPSTMSDPNQWTNLGVFLRSSQFTNNNINSWIVEPQVSYDKNFNSVGVNVIVGTTFLQNSSYGQNITGAGYNNDVVLEDLKSASTVIINSTLNSEYKYNAIFSRASFNFKSKYLINLTARRDGSSRFGPENRFHNFGSAGAAWVFSNEGFVQKNLKFISFGKIRASYGTTGNDQIGDYGFLDLYSPTSVGVPYQGTNGLRFTRLYTPDLAWEETKKFEAGFEIGFLKDRVVFNVSRYINRSSNQLTDYSLPSVTGARSIKKNLDALVQNAGWEFLLITSNINSKNFQWNSSLNFSLNRNKLLSVDPAMSPIFQRLVGHALSTQFVYHSLGTDANTGVYVFDNGKGGPTTMPDTSFQLSQQPIHTFPKFFGGFQHSFTFKGLQLDFLFQFVKQKALNYLFNSLPGSYYSGNQPVMVLERWQNPGDIKPIQRFNTDYSIYQGITNLELSDAMWTDASYIRLKNLSLSYEMPKSWIRKIHFQQAKIYVHAQNLLTFTDYKGLDPETASSITLPPLRVVTMGVQVTF